ncbi:hypothetical protein CCM_01711 [Cordyceps militaris CM01]|uniref:Uncharacterized protein n=1 Tax=Cordyceps militaris (strain CM01) TaxID=983644 RepID=G3J6M4_CORMM|nr:uncharacterized protein CCM_01711 [Cordyceps militaris CM01]EGX97052.1 hypothetical protein CCM_01711 [Cordyceps militaris CM01]
MFSHSMALCDEDRIEAAIMSGPRAWAAADGPHSGVLAHSSTDDDQRAAAAVVAFDLAYDAANPLNWRAGKKWVVTDVLFATGFNRIMVSARAARHCLRAHEGALIAARFLAGFGAPAPSKHSARASLLEQRRRPLSVYLMTPLLGAGVGPIIAGFIDAVSVKGIVNYGILYVVLWTFLSSRCASTASR